jgi:diguanylate cyclase (GGDEF)-like protein
VLGTIVFAPLAVVDFLAGRWLLSGAILFALGGFLIDAIIYLRKGRPPIPYAVLLLLMVVAMAVSVRAQGVIGLFWSYPAILFVHFVLARRMALLLSLVLLVGVSAMAWWSFGLAFAVRVFLSNALTIGLMNLALAMIDHLQRRLLEHAIRDPLTGVYNRRYLDARLGELIIRHRRRPAPSTVLLVDVDHFKEVNDELGHDAGDRVLQQLVQVLQQRLRRSDLVFRMGGEEFLVLLPDTDAAGGVTVAENLRAAVAEAALLPERTITVSVGVAEIRASDTVPTWTKRADQAMYVAKEAGRNLVRAWESEAPVREAAG